MAAVFIALAPKQRLRQGTVEAKTGTAVKVGITFFKVEALRLTEISARLHEDSQTPNDPGKNNGDWDDQAVSDRSQP